MTNDSLVSPAATAPAEILSSEAISARPRIRVAQFDDYAQIAAVEARQGLTVKPREKWLDLWRTNPAYAGLPDWPIGWVIEDSNGQIVGSLGNVPSVFYFEAEKYICAAGRGWAVDAKYRAYAVMLLAHQRRCPNVDLNVITTPSPTTAKLCVRLGWSRVPFGKWNRSAFWVTNYSKAVQACLGSSAPGLVSTAIGSLLSPPLSLRDRISGWPAPIPRQYRLEWCTGFDSGFDEFWERLQQKRPHLVLGTRSVDALRWHFKSSLEQGRVWILAARQGGRLDAYAILERRVGHAFDLTRVLFVDYQDLTDKPRLFRAMIHCVLQRCRRDGVHILENPGCWVEMRHAVRPAPFRRALASWCYFYSATNPALELALRNPTSWYPTQYDGDASL